MKLRHLLGTGLAVVTALGWADANAQWFPLPSGPMSYYVGVEGGYTGLEDATGRIVNSGNRTRERFDDGYNAGGRVGVEWGNWRFEEEIRFQRNKKKSVLFRGLPCGTDTFGARMDRQD